LGCWTFLAVLDKPGSILSLFFGTLSMNKLKAQVVNCSAPLESSIAREPEVFKPVEGAAMTPKVLLTDTTRYSCATRLAIAFSKAGMEVSALLPARGHPLLKTRVLREVFPYSGLRPLESLEAAIEATGPQIIVPCDDIAVQHLHDLHARASARGQSGRDLASLIVRSLGPPPSYPIVSSRYGLLQIAREEGLRVPETSLINTVDEIKSWGQGRKLPWVLKADGTWGGRGVRIAHTPIEAEKFFLRLTRPPGTAHVVRQVIVNRNPFGLRPWWNRSGRKIIVQSYIQGRPSNCAVVCQEGRILAGIAVEVVNSQGPTGPATVVRVVDGPEMMFCAERIAHRLKLSGFFGLDFMIEEQSGDTYLIEMNPRGTPPCHLQLGKGRDMVNALRAQLSDQPVRETEPVTQNDLIAYFPQAWHYKTEMPKAGFQDIPLDQPELVKEILRPWPDRSPLALAYNHIWEFWCHLTSEKKPISPESS
jgi:hypothetical protein